MTGADRAATRPDNECRTPRIPPSARSRMGFAAILLLLAACADTAEDRMRGPDGAGSYKIGKPYQVAGVWYYPKVDYDYDEIGIASWYGHPFHGRYTANGEIFDEDAISAAHTTLPLPSLVRVTNLDNDRALIVRVNDRGPFVAGRIIDGVPFGLQTDRQRAFVAIGVRGDRKTRLVGRHLRRFGRRCPGPGKVRNARQSDDNHDWNRPPPTAAGGAGRPVGFSWHGPAVARTRMDGGEHTSAQQRRESQAGVH